MVVRSRILQNDGLPQVLGRDEAPVVLAMSSRRPERRSGETEVKGRATLFERVAVNFPQFPIPPGQLPCPEAFAALPLDFREPGCPETPLFEDCQRRGKAPSRGRPSVSLPATPLHAGCFVPARNRKWSPCRRSQSLVPEGTGPNGGRLPCGTLPGVPSPPPLNADDESVQKQQASENGGAEPSPECVARFLFCASSVRLEYCIAQFFPPRKIAAKMTALRNRPPGWIGKFPVFETWCGRLSFDGPFSS